MPVTVIVGRVDGLGYISKEKSLRKSETKGSPTLHRGAEWGRGESQLCGKHPAVVVFLSG